MNKEKLSSQLEVYICNHKAEGKENCFDRGAKELTDQLKKWAKEETEGKIKVVRGGCLGQCHRGIAMSCYPEHTLFTEIKSQDTEEIKQGLREALNKIKD